ncbi:hypothetical protein ACWD95_12375, partial [Streptomyces sp. NPDC005069]
VAGLAVTEATALFQVRAPAPLLCPGPRRDAVRLPDNGLDKEAVDIRIMERQPCQFVRLKESL